MYEIRTVVLASVLAGLLLLAALPAPASAGLAGFQYQREITIHENSGETLRNYQVPVELSGSDFPEEAKTDGDDIRFTDADGVNLSYWIEEFNAGSKRAKIWVKVPLIPANGETEITMWYGNPSARGVSDGDAVFEFFDDFGGTSLDTDKWTALSGTAVKVADGHLTIDGYGRDGGLYTNSFTCPAQCVIEWRGMLTESEWTLSTGFYVTGHPLWHFAGGFREDMDKVRVFVDGDENYAHKNIDLNIWYRAKTYLLSNEIKEDVEKTIISKSCSIRKNLPVSLYAYNEGRYDFIAVRRYTSPEPTVTLAPPAPAAHTALTITKSPAPHSIRQFDETTITISIKNTGTADATDIEITDSVHPSFDLTSGDFPSPLRYDLIRPGETRDLQYTIRAMESGTFKLDPATVTYADEDGNIQEAKSEPVSIKVIPSTEGGISGGTPGSNPSVSTASVHLYGEKTDVVLGEDILLKLSAVNLITKPTMHVQVIIIPPSGMSVTSSAFAKSGAGQYTTTYELEPGTGKDIEVAIRSNQVGDFDVNGRIVYYFGDDREDAEDHTLTLPIKVRAKAESGAEQRETPSESKETSTPGFAALVAVAGLLAVYLWRKRR
ncbi:MAG: hypothetical protein KBONHNOK_00600 [Candidatus Methanoperedenaceae archaeon GB50]|nr:MAG: hypothetical protein KBONHNOK_00600 [Candidatus Methanoperedenaceae archaeon GB50]